MLTFVCVVECGGGNQGFCNCVVEIPPVREAQDGGYLVTSQDKVLLWLVRVYWKSGGGWSSFGSCFVLFHKGGFSDSHLRGKGGGKRGDEDVALRKERLLTTEESR